jgi:hypothetical protein
VLAAKNELLGKFDGASIGSETLQVVGGWTGDTLQDLD